jgi:hypothetical protein
MPKAIDTSSTNVVAIPTRPRTAVESLPEVAAAHNKLVAILAASRPHVILGFAAHRFDIMRRRDHLDMILRATLDYAKAIVEDTAHLAPIGYIADETGFLEDSVSTIYGAFDEAVERLIEDQETAE